MEGQDSHRESCCTAHGVLEYVHKARRAVEQYGGVVEGTVGPVGGEQAGLLWQNPGFGNYDEVK